MLWHSAALSLMTFQIRLLLFLINYALMLQAVLDQWGEVWTLCLPTGHSTVVMTFLKGEIRFFFFNQLRCFSCNYQAGQRLLNCHWTRINRSLYAHWSGPYRFLSDVLVHWITRLNPRKKKQRAVKILIMSWKMLNCSVELRGPAEVGDDFSVGFVFSFRRCTTLCWLEGDFEADTEQMVEKMVWWMLCMDCSS